MGSSVALGQSQLMPCRVMSCPAQYRHPRIAPLHQGLLSSSLILIYPPSSSFLVPMTFLDLNWGTPHEVWADSTEWDYQALGLHQSEPSLASSFSSSFASSQSWLHLSKTFSNILSDSSQVHESLFSSASSKTRVQLCRSLSQMELSHRYSFPSQ